MRKRWRLISLGFLLCVLLAADWPQLQGPRRDGHAADEPLLETWPASGPPVLWKRALGEGFASPVVVDGQVLMFHRVGGTEVLECLEASNGKVRWTFRYPTRYEDAYAKGNGPRSTPVVADGRVFLLGAEGMVHAVEFATGKKLWNRSLADDYRIPPSFFGIATTPLVEGKKLLVNVGGDEGAGIVAFDVTTGKEVWKATDQQASYSSPIAATIDGVRHVFFFTREGLVGIDPDTGKVRFSKRWRSRINASVNAAMPVLVGGDHVFLSSSYQTGAILLRVQKDRVREAWSNDTSLSCHYSTPVLVGDHLYGFHGRQEEGAELRCVEARTGKVCWSEPGYGCGSAIVIGKRILVLTEKGQLVLLRANPEKHDVVAMAEPLGPCRAHAALADGRLFLRDDKKLVVLKLSP